MTNLGSAGQPNNTLQFVDIWQYGNKLDDKGIPPLAPGQSANFSYMWQRSAEAARGSTDPELPDPHGTRLGLQSGQRHLQPDALNTKHFGEAVEQTAFADDADDAVFDRFVCGDLAGHDGANARAGLDHAVGAGKRRRRGFDPAVVHARAHDDVAEP